MGYQTGNRTITLTSDGQPVQWIVNYDAKTVTVAVMGIVIGTFPNRMVAMETLGLKNVPAQGKRAA